MWLEARKKQEFIILLKPDWCTVSREGLESGDQPDGPLMDSSPLLLALCVTQCYGVRLGSACPHPGKPVY